ncbi:D-aminoacyl-tRNA deacylase [Nocardia sp. R7R-8]|uniref:D-aminoacyl-tRNA deacylase n=1 Tax=Nocardia sp. R7R-8 TaxID=3459304 RepID=UPI00403DBD79
MRALLQRVSSARVTVGEQVVGRIDPVADGLPHGLVALIGVTHSDTEATARALADKVWRLRVLDGERSAADLGAPILVVSQFTLYADTKKGRRPSWSAAAPGAVAEPLVEHFAQALRELGATVASGRFGAHMHIDLVNDGPVTLMVEL